MDSVTASALGELIATTVAATAGKSWKKIKSSPEAKTVERAVDRALFAAFFDARRNGGVADDDWVAEVAQVWEPAFTTKVLDALVACLTNPFEDPLQFAVLASKALTETGCDVVELEHTFWVEQFLCMLPRLVFEELRIAALSSDSAVRNLVGHLLDQRADIKAADAQVTIATPRQFREDVIALLHRLDEKARTGHLPPYLPHGADVSMLARTVRVRRGIRANLWLEGPTESDAKVGRAYRLPTERAEDSEPARPWPEVVAKNRRLVVLADPGLGKSWLIRTETHRLCLQALAAVQRGKYLDALLVPVPIRCDQLAAARGQSLGEAVAEHFVTARLLPPRSRSKLQVLVDAGQIVLLLDALDELATAEQYGRLKEMLRTWQVQVGDRARCVLTSRIAGYRGSLLLDAREVELQTLTHEDVLACVATLQLPPPVAAKILDQIRDPAVAGMARVPLLLSMLCSLAAELPSVQHFPSTRGALYDRILRWFLTNAHRADEHPNNAELLAEEVDALLDILAPVAFHFATLPTGWTDLMPADQLRNAIRCVGPAFTERNRPADEIVRGLSIGAGILVPEGNPSAGRRPNYLFLHRTVAEYLVARHLATLSVSDWLDVVNKHLWFDADWAEVIPLLGGQLESNAARQLVESLLRQHDDPFHYALLAALRIMAERSDLDHLLSDEDMRNVVNTVLSLIECPVTRGAVIPFLAATHRLPVLLVDRLLARLTDPDSEVRWAAVRALAGRDLSKVTEALLCCLGDPDWYVRRTVVDALVGQDTPLVIDALLTCLSDPDSEVRWGAVRALADHETPAVTDALLALLDDPHRGVRRGVVDALAGRNTPSVIDALLNCLNDPDPGVCRAVKALAVRDTAAVIDALLARLDDPDHQMRQAAVNALAAQDTPAVTDALLARLDAPNWGMRCAAVDALATKETPGVTDALLARLNDACPRVRRAAVDALATRGVSAVTDALLTRLDDPDRQVRCVAVRALAERDTQAVTDALLERLHDRHPGMRGAAVYALAGRDTQAVTDALLNCLGDPDPWVRHTTMAVLVDMDSLPVTDALLTRIDHPSRLVRGAVMQLLSETDSYAVTEALLACLDHPDEQRRQTAVRLLAKRDAPAVTDGLLARLDDPDWEIRHAAVQALTKRDAPAVTDGLLARLDDPDWQVRHAAVQALTTRTAPEVTEALSARIGDPDWYVRRAVVGALSDRATLGELSTLSHQIRKLDPGVLGAAYDIAYRVMNKVFLNIPLESRDDVRANFAWLTEAVLSAARES